MNDDVSVDVNHGCSFPLEWFDEAASQGGVASPHPRSFRPSFIAPQLYLGGEKDVDDLRGLIHRLPRCRLVVRCGAPLLRPLDSPHPASCSDSPCTGTEGSTSSSSQCQCDEERRAADGPWDERSECYCDAWIGPLTAPSTSGGSWRRLSASDAVDVLSTGGMTCDGLTCAESGGSHADDAGGVGPAESPKFPAFVIVRLNIVAEDATHVDLRQHFAVTTRFIDRARANGWDVVVHCKAGISRSSTIVAAYLLSRGFAAHYRHRQTGRHVDGGTAPPPRAESRGTAERRDMADDKVHAVHAVVRWMQYRRAVVCPNPGFMSQLAEHVAGCWVAMDGM